MKVVIKDDFIKIGQLLKKINLISSGGEAKFFLLENTVLVNNEKPIGRNSKVSVNSIVKINDDIYYVVNE